MSLPIEELKKVAHLARLNVDDAKLVGFSKDFANILSLVDQMKSVDTQNVTPMAHPLKISQRTLPDEVTETNQRDLFQSCTPHTEYGLYLVPKVIE